MGLFDNFALPTPTQYISTYAGQPLEETAALGQELKESYWRGLEGVSAYNVMRNNIDVLDVDQEMKDAILDKSYEGLKKYAERGDYENAVPAVMQATQMVSGNRRLKEAMQAKKQLTEFSNELEKRFTDGKIERWQYDLARQRLGGYKGVAEGDSVSNYMRQPSKPVDIRKLMQDGASKVRAETIRENPIWNDQLGKFEIKETKTYDPEELDAAIASSIGNPATQEYIAEMREAYGDAVVDDMIQQHRVSVIRAMHSTDPSVQYVEPGKRAGKGAPGTGGAIGPPGTHEAMPLLKKEGVDYVQAGEDIEFDWNTSFEERAKMREQMNKSGGGFWNNVSNSISAWWNDVPTDEEIESFNKIADTTQNFFDIPDETWNGYTPEQREEKMKEYINGAGKHQTQLNIVPVNVNEEISNRKLPDTADGYSAAKIGDEIVKDIERNYQSRAFYSLDEQDIVTDISDDDALSKAFAGEKGYSMTVLGNADPKNMFTSASENPAMASSYIVKVETPDGPKNYMVSKDAGYQKAPSSAMRSYPKARGVTNEQYNNKVSEIFSTFPAPAYTDTYEDPNGVSFVGERDKDNMSSIIISDLKIKGQSIDLQQIANALGLPYDEQEGKLYGANDEIVAQMVINLGLTN